MQGENSLEKKDTLQSIELVKIGLIKNSGIRYRMKKIKGPANAANVVKKFLAGEDREVFLTLCLDNCSNINSINVVSIGGLDGTLVHPRDVFKSAILSNAKVVIVAHNHPSGNPEPSDNDCQRTIELIKSGEILKIDVRDHIIVGDSKYSYMSGWHEDKKGMKIRWATGSFEEDLGGAAGRFDHGEEGELDSSRGTLQEGCRNEPKAIAEKRALSRRDAYAKDVHGLITLVDEAARKVRFITEVFSQNICNENLLSQDARAGLHFMLNDLEDDLEFVVDQYYHRPDLVRISKKEEAT